MHSSCSLLTAAMLIATPAAAMSASAQELTPAQLSGIQRGAAEVHIGGGLTTVPLHGAPELPLVEVTLNGTGPFQFLVDLGSNVLIARRSVLDRAGATMMVDRSGTDLMQVPTLEIGRAEYRDVWIGGVDELDVDGVIGYNMLSLSPFELDFRERAVTIGRSGIADEAAVIRYTDDTRMPYIEATAAGRPVLLNLDTGASNWITLPGYLADSLPLLGPPAPGPLLWNNQTGSKRVDVARLDGDLSFGRYRLPNPVVYFDDTVDDAWIGAALLRDGAVRIDPASRNLELALEDSVLYVPPLRTAGFAMSATGETRLVEDVIPGTVAALVMRVGDTVMTVASREAGQLDRRFLRHFADTSESVKVLLGTRNGRVEAQVPVTELGVAPIVHGDASAAAIAALDEARRAFSAHYMAGRGDSVAAAYTAAPYVLPPGSEVRRRRTIGRLFTVGPGREVLHHAMTPEVLWVTDSLIVEKGRWTQLSRVPSGRLTGGAADYVAMWVYEGGEWRLELDIWHR